MTLRTRLALGLALVALLLAIPLGFALRALGSAQRAAATLRGQEVAASLLLGSVRDRTQNLRRAENALLFVADDSSGASWLQREARHLAALGDSLRPYALDTLAAQLHRSGATIQTFAPLEWTAVLERRPEAADRISETHIEPAIAAVEGALGAAEQTVRLRAQRRADATSAETSAAWTLALGLLAAALVGALVVAYWLTRSISRPVAALERGMYAVASGDFTHPLALSAQRRDEFGRLATSYDGMTRRLAELDKLKAEFVSIASHELKTPINVMLGYLTLLEDGLYGPVPGEQREVLGTVATQARTLARLTQHLLDVSRFQGGTARLEPLPMALRNFLGELERTFHVVALQRGVRFVVAPAAELPEVVTWDRDRMLEVVSNLLSNAFKFTEPGGEVQLSASAARVPGERAVHLAVRDTGAGIPAEQLPHIFDKFFQADNQQSASQKGTGLGLAITREIVEAHGGSIAVESAVGRGTRFTLVVPVDAGTPDGIGDAPSAAGEHANARPSGHAPMTAVAGAERA